MGLGTEGAPVQVVISAWPWDKYLGDSPVKVKTSTYMRNHPRSIPSYAKISGSYVNSILASMEAKKQGYDEALLLDSIGNIAEGPGENFFLVKGNTLFTPVQGSILPGITRESIIKIARDRGHIVREIPLHPKESYHADEAFFTGTAAEVTPILSLDDVPFSFSPGELTTELRERYNDIVHGRQPFYNDWLTEIK
jgi:branched-chain amino acid aminotransferase